MYLETFQNAGLTNTQAEIYNFLLENGEFKARDIAHELKRPRGGIYRGLEELAELGLVERKDAKNKISTFLAEHPSKLEKLFSIKEKEVIREKKSYVEIIPDLVSIYNLSQNKPGVKFYEGEEGFKKVVNDTLKSKTEIYAFVDVKPIADGLTEYRNNYLKKRIRVGINKKVIAPKSAEDFYRKSGYNEFTEVRFLKSDSSPFKTGMQIYDNKISYQTMDEENTIAVLIEDKNIYEMHKLFFEYIWESLV